jgi:SAM-dependent methyltransferase
MAEFNRKDHWENIYNTKNLDEVSWYQPTPITSLQYIKEFNIPLTAKIIDVGGGDSFFVDNLLELGYSDITVVDISKNAIERAKKRLDKKANLVKWIVADAAHFTPTEHYDFWHDRAAFHFLTDANDINNYVNTVKTSINSNRTLVIGTFSEQGPLKCSGIEIKQYSENSMSKLFAADFNKVACQIINHKTPFDTTQNFVFCSFTKK